MHEIADHQEFRERLELIETMIAEGRQTTESWGWSFLLWGIAYYVAIAWSVWGPSANVAWPVTMIAAGILTGVLSSRQARRGPVTTVGRSMAAIWTSLGVSLFLFGLCSGLSHRIEAHMSVAVVAVMLGMANAASSIVLHWKLQFGCAIVWWTAGVVALFGSVTQGRVAFLGAIFLCQIVFGSYLMISDTRKAGPCGTVMNHA